MAMEAAAAALALLTVIILAQPLHACSNGQCQMQEKCSRDEDCSSGLYCSSCPVAGVVQPICIRTKLAMPARTDLPFNKYAWLTTHNSFAISSEKPRFPFPRVAPTNQEDSVTSQLQNGVRGLMLDMYDFQGDIWLCHSLGGQCLVPTAFSPAIETMVEIETFLSANTQAVVTIFIEDYVNSPNGLSKLFDRAGLSKFRFPLSRMPAAGEQWPTLGDMIDQNQRLLVFTSKSSKEQIEGIAYQWRYTVENQYGDKGTKAGQCTARGESPPLSSKLSLFVENYFADTPMKELACRDHSSGLYNMLSVCSKAGSRWANFLAVDFYKRSMGTGVFQAVMNLNINLGSQTN